MDKHGHTLSILIHTKNEEKNIARCIKSCRAIADEIVVADMNSSDKTVLIAKKLGARILEVFDYGYVEPARQTGIDSLSCDWILILDADEVITSSLQKKILECIKENSSNIYKIPRKNIFLGKWMRFGLLWPDYQVRLFRKGTVKWLSAIHSQPKLLSAYKELPAVGKYAITHYHQTSIKQFQLDLLE